MALSVKHSFSSSKADGTDTTKVQASNWNAEHRLTATINSVLGTDGASTTVKELDCTAAGRSVLAAADAGAQKVALNVAEIPIGGGFEWYTTNLPASNGTVVWAWANGQAVSRTTYSALFALLGTFYGTGDGSTTFNIPDRREVTAVGTRGMGGTSGRGLYGSFYSIDTIGSVVGSETVTLTASQIPSHTHNFSGTTTTESVLHTHAGTTSGQSANHTHDTFVSLSGTTSADGDHTHNVNMSNNTLGGINVPPTSGSGTVTTSETTSTNGSHTHSWSGSGTFTSGVPSGDHTHIFATSTQSAFHTHDFSGTTDGGTGGGQAHGNVPPTMACNFVMRLL